MTDEDGFHPLKKWSNATVHENHAGGAEGPKMTTLEEKYVRQVRGEDLLMRTGRSGACRGGRAGPEKKNYVSAIRGRLNTLKAKRKELVS